MLRRISEVSINGFELPFNLIVKGAFGAHPLTLSVRIFLLCSEQITRFI
jgi:hypothetical protein